MKFLLNRSSTISNEYDDDDDDDDADAGNSVSCTRNCGVCMKSW